MHYEGSLGTNMANALIKLTNVSQSFTINKETITPLKSVNLEILENSFNIIFGPSGSGKSTLLNAISGLQKPTSGSVTFQGQNVYGLKPDELAHFRANRLGIIYQDNYWVKSLNVVENVAMQLAFLGYNRTKANKMAMDALERVNMVSYARKMPFLLSLGEQQRVAAARAVANNPLFIIADEPTGNLDSTNGDIMMDLLLKCQNEFKCTIILVTHNLEYLPLADNLLHMKDGTLQDIQTKSFVATTEALLRDRIDRFTKVKAHASQK